MDESLKRRLSGLVLALALLLGQAALLAHEYDFSIHKGMDHCQVCLHASPLKGAAGSYFSFELPHLFSTTVFFFEVEKLTFAVSSVYHARAPPAFQPH